MYAYVKQTGQKVRASQLEKSHICSSLTKANTRDKSKVRMTRFTSPLVANFCSFASSAYLYVFFPCSLPTYNCFPLTNHRTLPLICIFALKLHKKKKCFDSLIYSYRKRPPQFLMPASNCCIFLVLEFSM